MRRTKFRRLIATLSAALVVGGVAITSIAVEQINIAQVESGKNYLPEMQKEWKAQAETPRNATVAVTSGTYLGVIKISSLRLKANLYEGTENKALSRGAGHYLRSVMPGESDNSVIAGHRDTVFASLGKLQKGEPIVIITRDGTFTYLVTGTRIVDKDDRTVIVPTDSATLTLSTCYPFRFIGSAPQRYIVSAAMVVKIY